MLGVLVNGEFGLLLMQKCFNNQGFQGLVGDDMSGCKRTCPKA